LVTIVKRLVLDVLKPHQPSIHELASKIASLHGIDSVNVSLAEIDEKTESVRISIDGGDIGIDAVRKCVEKVGAVIHSIDEVAVAKRPHQK